MRIVDVCAFYSPQGGGVKTYIEQKLRLAPAMGHDVTILAPADEDAVIDYGASARIITIASPRFPLDRKYWYFDDEQALHARLDTLVPDLVEVSSPWRSPSMVARWKGRAPRTLVMHADPLAAYAYRWFGPVMPRTAIDRQFGYYWQHLRRLSQQFDRVVCANDNLRQRLARGGVANTVTIPMGVAPGLFSSNKRDQAVRRELLGHCGLPEEGRLLIGAGRLSAEKRWPMVIDAVVAASNSLPIGLVLFGEGSERARIERHIGGNPHIRLMGLEPDRDRFATIMASADALIHGCEAETFCMAAAEARASGTPVIVPDSGGAVDHARGGCGETYKSANPLAASQAILHVLQARRAASVHPFTMQDHFDRLFANYAGLLEGDRHVA